MTKLVSVALAAAAALAAVSSATPLLAAPAISYATATVSYRDLDLASSEGTKMLDRRIRTAVGKVCGTANGPNLAEFRAVQNCRKGAFASARPQVALALATQGRGNVVIAASR